MPLTSGARLGPYEVVAPLGAGGMGEVWRARDTRLGRDVALKVLPAHLADTPEARARLDREAKVVSSLNHPNICTLHDVGHEDGTDYLVMELIDGETLSARLTAGSLAPAEVLRVGAQIAEALAFAHRRGIVHRDLKPGNVMLTRSGAKLMDFGLSRATEPTASAGLSASATRTTPLTAEGALVGTFQYMSPEQLEGKEADTRADIWALGCVLYEMATGRRAFSGGTQASLISAIMRDQPRPIGEFAPLTPPALDRLVRHCLEKDPDDRWQSAGDLKRELGWIAESSSSGTATAIAGTPGRPAPRRARPAWLPWAACGVLATALALALLLPAARVPRPDDAARPLRFLIPQAENVTLRVPCEPALAADGSTLCFVQTDSSGVARLALRRLRSTEVRTLTGTEGASLPFWSPDGRWVGYFANAKLHKVALDGSTPVVLCDAPDGRGGAWTPSGTILFAPNNSGPLWRVSEAGGEAIQVTRPDTASGEFGQRYPHLLPDGRHFLYISIRPSDRHTVCLGDLRDGRTRPLFASLSAARYARGFLLTNEEGRIMARRFDAQRLAVSGDPQLVAEGAEQDNIGYDNLAVDGRGTLAFQRVAPRPARLLWLGKDGSLAPSAWGRLPQIGYPSLTPDGSRLVYQTRDPLDLWVYEGDGAAPVRLTFDDHVINSYVISADGRRVALARQLGSGGYELRVKPLDGSGPETPLFRGPGLFTLPAAWSPDGQWIVTLVSDAAGSFDFWLVPVSGAGEPRVFERTPAQEYAGGISPDGRWLAYAAIEKDRVAVYLVSFPTPSVKYQLALTEPIVPFVVWSRGGRQLRTMNHRNQLLGIDVQLDPTFRQGATRTLFTLPANSTPVGMPPDESRLLLARTEPGGEPDALEVAIGWEEGIGGTR